MRSKSEASALAHGTIDSAFTPMLARRFAVPPHLAHSMLLAFSNPFYLDLFYPSHCSTIKKNSDMTLKYKAKNLVNLTAMVAKQAFRKTTLQRAKPLRGSNVNSHFPANRLVGYNPCCNQLFLF